MQRFVPFDGWAYSLLLGLYLGDGCVSSTGRSYQLRVVLDGLYPEVIDDCVMAITLSLRKAGSTCTSGTGGPTAA